MAKHYCANRSLYGATAASSQWAHQDLCPSGLQDFAAIGCLSSQGQPNQCLLVTGFRSAGDKADLQNRHANTVAPGAENGSEHWQTDLPDLSFIHISEPTRQAEISYAVFCLGCPAGVCDEDGVDDDKEDDDDNGEAGPPDREQPGGDDDDEDENDNDAPLPDLF